MLQGREFGLEITTTAYRFVEYDPIANQWAEFFDDDYLQYWSLPEGLEFDLFLEDQRVVLDTEPVEIEYDPQPGEVTEDYAPHLLIFSSGDSTPFELHVIRESDDFRVAVEGDLLGNLEIMQNDDINR